MLGIDASDFVGSGASSDAIKACLSHKHAVNPHAQRLLTASMRAAAPQFQAKAKSKAKQKPKAKAKASPKAKSGPKSKPAPKPKTKPREPKGPTAYATEKEKFLKQTLGLKQMSLYET